MCSQRSSFPGEIPRDFEILIVECRPHSTLIQPSFNPHSTLIVECDLKGATGLPLRQEDVVAVDVRGVDHRVDAVRCGLRHRVREEAHDVLRVNAEQLACRERRG